MADVRGSRLEIWQKRWRMARRRGRALEELVAAIERALALDSTAKITSPGRIRHRVTGKMREVDVLITRGDGRHKIVTAIECKDWKKVVSDIVVEHFAKKCAALHVNKVIIVSSKGFTREALIDAQHEGVSCLSLSDATSFDWMSPTAVFTHNQCLKRFHWMFDLGPGGPKLASGFVVEDSAGTLVPWDVLNAQADVQIAKEVGAPPVEPGEVVHELRFDRVDNLYARDPSTRAAYSIVKAIVRATYQYLPVKQSPIRLHEYLDHQAGERFEIAQSELDIGGTRARLMFVPNEQGGKAVKLVLDPKK
jgi:Restriction endonuclease